MIKVKKSPTADSRNSDFSEVSKQKLLQSTESHISEIPSELLQQAFYNTVKKLINNIVIINQ